MFERPAVFIQSTSLAGDHFGVRAASKSYQPPPRRLAQLVTVNPNVNVSVNTGLEQYLFPAGLLAGGGAAFLIGTAVPSEYRKYSTMAGVALVIAGVGVLLYRGLKGKSDGAAAPQKPASGGVAVDNPPAFVPPSQDAFRTLQVAIVSPGPSQEIEHSGGFLGFGEKAIPVQLRMYNPAPSEVTFNLDFTWEEYPSFGGYDRGHFLGSKSFQVTLGAGEQKNQTFDLPIRSDLSWTQIQGSLQMYSRRTPVENQQLLGNVTFTVV